MSKKEIIGVSLVMYLFIGFCAFLMFVHFEDDIGRDAAIRGGVIVEATWVGIIPNMHKGGTPTTYDLGYEYIAEDGTKYREECSMGIRNREDAVSRMGTKIDIYIDGKGHSIPVFKADSFNMYDCLIWGIVIVSLIFLYTVWLVIWCILAHKKKKKKLLADLQLENFNIDDL